MDSMDNVRLYGKIRLILCFAFFVEFPEVSEEAIVTWWKLR